MKDRNVAKAGDRCGKADTPQKTALLHLHPQVLGAEVARAIFKQQQDIIHRNESGVRRGRDPEFLHDFRVAIRRTRSALTQLKGALPLERAVHFNARFRDLGRSTGRLRDLDVYLSSRDAYRMLLPLALRAGLTPMFLRLQRLRQQAQREVVGVLDGPMYAALKADWADFLDGDWSGDAPDALMPAVDLARKLIDRRYRRVIDRGSAIGETTPDEAMHQLRIECKKLRYVMEFFASLFDADEMVSLIASLKVLQDNLGVFNDLSVQQAELLRELDAVLPRSRRAGRVLRAAATGGLVARLYEKQRQARSGFAEVFAAFAHPDQVRRWEQLFGVQFFSLEGRL